MQCGKKADEWLTRKFAGARNKRKRKKNLSLLWKRSDIELQSISVHHERLKTCADRLHWCCVSSTSSFTPFGVILSDLKNNDNSNKSCCCCICHFPSHFTQIRAHGRRDLLAIFWVFMKLLPHFQSRKNRPLARLSWRSQIRISRIPACKQKARPLPKNVINISCCMLRRRTKWGSSRMWELVGRWPGGRGGGGGEGGRGEAFSHSHFIPPARFYQHVGLLRLFIWSCMMKEQLSKFAADRKALSVWLREGNPDAHFTHCDSAGCKGNVATRTANLATLSKNNNNKKQKKLIPYAAVFFHYDYLPIVLHISLLYALRAHTTCQRWCCWSEQRGKKPPLF